MARTTPATAKVATTPRTRKPTVVDAADAVGRELEEALAKPENAAKLVERTAKVTGRRTARHPL